MASKQDLNQIMDTYPRSSPNASALEDNNDKPLPQNVDDDPEFSHREQRRIIHRLIVVWSL